MSNSDGQARGGWHLGMPAAAVAVAALVLAGCGRAGTTEVTTAFPPRPPSTTAPPVPTSIFQGAVASVDPVGNEIRVGVTIVWAPVLKADPHERRVAVGPQTRWAPGPASLADLHLGDEVQVEAEDRGDGTWRAIEVSLLDVD